MKLSEIIKKRTSNSKFIDQPVDSNLLIELLETAVYAPNHKMREPWRFIIIENEHKKHFVDHYLNALNEEQKVQMEPLVNKLFSAPTVVAFVTPQNKDLRDGLEDLEAVAMLIQNFMLLATEAGLATSIKTPLYSESDKFKDILGLNPGEIIVGMVMVGYSDWDKPAKPRKSAASLTTFYR